MNDNAHLVTSLDFSLVPVALRVLKRLRKEKVEAAITIPGKRQKQTRARSFEVRVRFNGQEVKEGELVNLASDILKATIQEVNSIQAGQVRSRGLKAYVSTQ